MVQETIREIIARKSEELRDPTNLGPVKASEALVELSSLLASLNKLISERQYWLNVLKMKKLEEFGSAAKAKIASDASKEWRELSEAVEQRDALIETMRALKFYIKAAMVEYEESKY